MPEALPEGIVTTTENIYSDIGTIDHVDIDDIATLWKVYGANRTALERDAGRRLENLFWRIWSNASIHRSIQGSTVARLFLRISEGDDFLRTTPTQTPEKRQVGDPNPHEPRGSASNVPIRERTDNRNDTVVNFGPEATASRHQPASSSQALPPPILKKGRSASDERTKTARVLSPEQTRTGPPWDLTRHDQPASRHGVEATSNERGGKKRASFVATTPSSRRRPAAVRRKSSQQSTGSSSSRTSPLLRSQPSAAEQPPHPGLSSQAAPGSGMSQVDDPSTQSESWQDMESLRLGSVAAPQNQPVATETFTGDQPTEWLVDRNFRSRFVESRQRRGNISGIGSIHSERGSGTDQRRRSSASDKGKGKMPENSEEVDLEIESDEDEDEDDVEGESESTNVPLPRTKSQLSMMIEREKEQAKGTRDDDDDG